MDLTWSPEEEGFRAEARAWLETELAAWHDRHGGRVLWHNRRVGTALGLREMAIR